MLRKQLKSCRVLSATESSGAVGSYMTNAGVWKADVQNESGVLVPEHARSLHERGTYFRARRRRRTAAATIPAPAASTANEAGSGTELPPPPPPGAGGHRYLPIMGM
jgi:hypothetical protein